MFAFPIPPPPTHPSRSHERHGMVRSTLLCRHVGLKVVLLMFRRRGPRRCLTSTSLRPCQRCQRRCWRGGNTGKQQDCTQPYRVTVELPAWLEEPSTPPSAPSSSGSGSLRGALAARRGRGFRGRGSRPRSRHLQIKHKNFVRARVVSGFAGIALRPDVFLTRHRVPGKNATIRVLYDFSVIRSPNKFAHITNRQTHVSYSHKGTGKATGKPKRTVARRLILANALCLQEKCT